MESAAGLQGPWVRLILQLLRQRIRSRGGWLRSAQTHVHPDL